MARKRRERNGQEALRAGELDAAGIREAWGDENEGERKKRSKEKGKAQ